MFCIIFCRNSSTAMTYIPAITHCDVSNMSIKDAPSVAYFSIFPLALVIILLGRLHIVITSRKTHWARKHLDYKNQVYQTLTRRAFLKTKKKIRWTNFINRKVILNKIKNENFARSRSMLAYFEQKLPRMLNKLTRKNAFQARKLFGNF